ncbi:GNAT family N-acetyltransferase [Saccharibacillus kuerlensis]|uniref:N-acetyltransferase n=1 Tax=Saccharibacillus kuerlensis TaxID=459527 RepID=A0ABQ2L2S6_9BACL|nr:GNAT family N-acetyltransferase [Saccharibacillus kuerlensis]GGO00659.1 N-acetyltransferase [Saccharibacillus kuerlensis]
MAAIEQQEDAFVMIEDGREVGKVSYMPREDGVLLLDHTFVDQSMRGQHVGEQLVESVVELARERGVKIDPVCPFASALFERKKEYEDVWQRD